MRINGYVTIYKLNTDITKYIAQNTFRCFYRLEKGSASEKSGMKGEDRLIVRIPAIGKIDISTGDYIYAGEKRMPDFDRKNAWRICNVCDNRCGTHPHYKVIAE